MKNMKKIKIIKQYKMKVYVVSSKMAIHGVYTNHEQAKEICQALIHKSMVTYRWAREYKIKELELDEFPKLLMK